MDYALPIAYALCLWWFSTGAIFYLDQLPVRTFKWSMGGATVLLALALYVIWSTATDPGLWAAYAAFTAGVIAWGWQEFSLYTGFCHRPAKAALSGGMLGLEAFRPRPWG